MQELALNSTSEVSFPVTEADLASQISPDPTDVFPPVFATARLVAFMELAAARLMRPLLGEGELSVGVSIETTHSFPTPLGARVRATAQFLGLEGKLYRFAVAAYDDAGEIGKGTHSRAIVSRERLIAGAARRKTPL